MNSFLVLVCFADIVSISLSTPLPNNNNAITSINYDEVAVKKEAIQILGNISESQGLKVIALDGQVKVNLTNTIDDEVPNTSHYNVSTVNKTYIRDDWNLEDLISNSLKFGNSPIGTNSPIKLIFCLLFFLGLLILILLCYYKLFIRYCYKLEYILDTV